MTYSKTYSPCDDCPHSFSKNNQESNVCKICEFNQALDRINRQKAEIERLEGLANHNRVLINELNKGIAESKTEAVKEFVMRFEKKIKEVKFTLGQTWEIQSALKEVKKEMVGEG